jgi:CheY-like chemotaxis protein
VGKSSNRLLLVDDDPLFRKFASRYLVAAGYVVRVAVDGLDAIRKLRGGPLDLIISDLNMPGMSGFEFLDVVRKRFPQIPVIVISGVPADELPEEVAADAYCPKTEFMSEQLLQTISDLTRRPNPRTSLPAVDNEPVRARWDGNGRIVISCDDCLREFSVPRIFHMGQDKKWTICVHCGKAVPFHVAEDSEGNQFDVN